MISWCVDGNPIYTLGEHVLNKILKFVRKIELRGCQNLIPAFYEILLIPGEICLPNNFFQLICISV